jgi:hypothetical protein
MIAASIGKKQIGKVLMGAVAVIVVAVGAIYFIGKGKEESSGAVRAPGATAEDREAYLLSVGIQVDTTSSVAEVAVPREFDERFSEYNEMIKKMGFDLEGLKGETVKKCTYTVTNRGDISASVSAVLLVYNDEIVAGHLIDNIENRLHPLFDVADETQAETTEETILPLEEVGEASGTPQETASEPDGTATVAGDGEAGEYPTE